MRAHALRPWDGSTELPAASILDARVEEARRIFRRTLASWASDCLVLRARGVGMRRWDVRDEAWYDDAGAAAA